MDNLTFLGFLFGPILMISFLITVLFIPAWIKRAKEEKLVGKDIHKLDGREVAEGGGIAVLMGFVIAIMLYIALRTFIFDDRTHIIEILAILGVLTLAGFIGIFDDLLGWKRGLSNRSRIIFLIFTAVPIMVLNLGDPNILGINFGLWFPLVLVPIGIVGATSTFNFLAGYNGLEASQGILFLSALSIVTFITGNPWLSLISACMVASLLAFWIFNKYPSKVFPGDILTYPVGALIACIAIIGNVELITIFFFIPYVLEVILKLRGKLKKESFGKIRKDGSLDLRYDKIYGLEHLAIVILKKIKGKAYEWEVPIVINLFQLIIIVLGFIIFF